MNTKYMFNIYIYIRTRSYRLYIFIKIEYCSISKNKQYKTATDSSIFDITVQVAYAGYNIHLIAIVETRYMRVGVCTYCYRKMQRCKVWYFSSYIITG